MHNGSWWKAFVHLTSTRELYVLPEGLDLKKLFFFGGLSTLAFHKSSKPSWMRKWVSEWKASSYCTKCEVNIKLRTVSVTSFVLTRHIPARTINLAIWYLSAVCLLSAVQSLSALEKEAWAWRNYSGDQSGYHFFIVATVMLCYSYFDCFFNHCGNLLIWDVIDGEPYQHHGHYKLMRYKISCSFTARQSTAYHLGGRCENEANRASSEKSLSQDLFSCTIARAISTACCLFCWTSQTSLSCCCCWHLGTKTCSSSSGHSEHHPWWLVLQ